MNKTLSKFFTFILAMGMLGAAALGTAQDSRTIDAQGVAFMQAQDPAIARDEAIADALRKAVEQAVGTMISSETVVKNFQLLSDKIYNRTQGYVRNYTIIKEWKEDNIYNVKVSAEVTTAELKDDLFALKLLQERKNKPRVMIMIEEHNIGQVNQWLNSINMSASETAITAKFQEKGFKIIDRRQAQKVAQANQVKLAVQGDASAAAAIAAQTRAEVIIVGKAISEDAGSIAGSAMKSIQGNVTLSAIKVDNAEVIATASAHSASPHISAMSGGTAAIKKASGKAAEQLITSIINKWQDELYNAATVQIMISKTDFGSLNKFKRVLKTGIRGIKSVNQRSLVNDVALLDVDVQGNAQYLANKITATSFPGFRFSVTSISQNRLDLQMIKVEETAVPATEDDSFEDEEVEPNNDLWHPNTLTLNGPIEGNIGEKGDVDCYLLETDGKEMEMKVKIEPAGPTELAYLVEIFDGDRNEVISKSTKPGRGVTFIFKTNKLFEKYFVKVSARKNMVDVEYSYILKLNSI